MTSTPPRPVTNVQLVDDSVVVRGMLRGMIEKNKSFQIIATSPNGAKGVEDYQKYNPDIVLMDIEMPEKDGLTALKEILQYDPQAKIIMCSSLTQSGAEATIEALRIGAMDCLAKPSSKTVDRSEAFEEQLMLKLRMFAKKASGVAKEKTAQPLKQAADLPVSTVPYPLPLPNSFPLAIAIGSSTGGPKALMEVLTGVSKKISLPIFITQHIPEGFSKFLAENIQKNTGFPTHEGAEDMIIEAGHIYVAPGGMHMGIKAGAPKRITLFNTPPVNFCKPSVDVMLESIAEHYGQGFLTVILTGMGADGRNAAQKITAAHKSNILLAQDKETSVVWGMPGAVAQAGICHSILPLNQIAPAINNLILRKEPGK